MKASILIVEDDSFKADDLKKELGEDYEIDIVTSVRDAVVNVLNYSYSVIILDMALPTFTANAISASGTAQPQGGVEVLRALKNTKKNIPVVIVSQYPDIEIDGSIHTLESSADILSKHYDIRVIGSVEYDFQDRGWVKNFRELIEIAEKH